MTRTASSRPAASIDVDHRGHHRVGERVALVGTVEVQAQHAVVVRDFEVDHRVANSALIAARACSRFFAPPGGSGRRTGPCSRLGSRIVA